MGPCFHGDRQEVRTFLSFDIVHTDEIFYFLGFLLAGGDKGYLGIISRTGVFLHMKREPKICVAHFFLCTCRVFCMPPVPQVLE